MKADLSNDELVFLARESLERASVAGVTDYANEMYFAYAAVETPDTVYLVDEEDLIDLGRRIHAGEADAYSLWCGATTQESTTAAKLIGLVPEWRTDKALDDLNGLREFAGGAADYLTCAAIDHLADQLRALRCD